MQKLYKLLPRQCLKPRQRSRSFTQHSPLNQAHCASFCTFNPKIDYYRILEVSFDSTQEQIRDQYYTLAKMYHPDLNTNEVRFNERKFREIKTAYEILGRDQTRQEYNDARGAQQSKKWSNGFRGVVVEKTNGAEQHRANESRGDFDFWADFGKESHSAYWNAYCTPPFEQEVKKQGFYTHDDFEFNQSPKEFKGRSERKKEDDVPEAQFVKMHS